MPRTAVTGRKRAQRHRAATMQRPHDASEPKRPADRAVTRLSSKNQITLPVAMVRALGMKPGDEIDVRALGDTIFVSRRPQTPDEWVAKFGGSMKIPGWGTREEIDAYVREERDSWTREGDDS